MPHYIVLWEGGLSRRVEGLSHPLVYLVTGEHLTIRAEGLGICATRGHKPPTLAILLSEAPCLTGETSVGAQAKKIRDFLAFDGLALWPNNRWGLQRGCRSLRGDLNP